MYVLILLNVRHRRLNALSEYFLYIRILRINLIAMLKANFRQVKIITLFDGRITLLFIEYIIKE